VVLHPNIHGSLGVKGPKHINVHGIEDKRQIIMVVSSAATRFVLLFQVMF
jgi:hypothetical protein